MTQRDRFSKSSPLLATQVSAFFLRHLSLPKELMGMFQFRMAITWQHVDSPDQLIPGFCATAPQSNDVHPKLSELYCRRWSVELDLRNIKVTLGVDVLSCRTPQMVVKELWVHLLAYNLIQLLMAQAASASDVDPRELSFKHTVQLWTEWTARRLSHCATRTDADLCKLIARIRVGNRAGRVEPRMRKRRPKSYPWLQITRVQARWQIIVHGKIAA
jgi:hypothetical protein